MCSSDLLSRLHTERLKAARQAFVDVVEFVAGNVGERSTADALMEAAQGQFGSVDIVVNNAGVVRDRMLFNMSDEDWDLVLEVHLRGHFLLCRNAAAYWRAKSKEAGAPVYGRIVNTSSMNYTGGGRPGATHYVAAKASIAGFTRVLAKEVGPDGITVNAIAPGYVATELIDGFSSPMLAVIREQNPTRRLCEPNEIGALVAYLASRQAGFINGEIVCIDGGRREFYWGNTA